MKKKLGASSGSKSPLAVTDASLQPIPGRQLAELNAKLTAN